MCAVEFFVQPAWHLIKQNGCHVKGAIKNTLKHDVRIWIWCSPGFTLAHYYKSADFKFSSTWRSFLLHFLKMNLSQQTWSSEKGGKQSGRGRRKAHGVFLHLSMGRGGFIILLHPSVPPKILFLGVSRTSATAAGAKVPLPQMEMLGCMPPKIPCMEAQLL